jgi:hypothetical protein
LRNRRILSVLRPSPHWNQQQEKRRGKPESGNPGTACCAKAGLGSHGPFQWPTLGRPEAKRLVPSEERMLGLDPQIPS